MKEKLLIQGESLQKPVGKTLAAELFLNSRYHLRLQKPVGKTLAAELFLNTRYHLRRNVLNGKLEFAPKTADEPSFRPLTQLALNSIILQAKREAISKPSARQSVVMRTLRPTLWSTSTPKMSFPTIPFRST